MKNPTDMRYDLIIIGSGPGGASVAREAARRECACWFWSAAARRR
ncbi:hypothetical protein ACHMW6_29415 [Pseudoduganella sp. UC29_106]